MIPAAVLISAGGVFLVRAPVLVVTDVSFNQLYGGARFRLKGARASLELFRRVTPVTVAESAGADLVSLAVEDASRRPFAVVFPGRYADAAGYYKEKYPSAPVLVVGAGRRTSDPKLIFAQADMVRDLYRAGEYAARFSGGKKVVHLYDGPLAEEYRTALREGLKKQGNLTEPVFADAFADASADYSSYADAGCVIIAGSAPKYLEQNLNIPVILFSWIDPGMTPVTVKIIFDDSPLAMAAAALKALPAGAGDISLPSEMAVLLDRIERKEKIQKN
jgi:hypothetical protein